MALTWPKSGPKSGPKVAQKVAQKVTQKVAQKVSKKMSQKVSQNDPKVMLNDVLSALADADEARYAETSIQNAARKMRQSFGPHYA